MIRLLLLIYLFLPVLSHPALPISLRAAGQTLEPCTQDSECSSPRTCVDTEFLAQCSANTTCICAPPVALQPCSNSDDCEQGELCAAGLPLISYSCVSDRIVATSPDLREVDATSDMPMGLNEGLSFDQCRTDLQCRGNRQCSLNGSVIVVPCDEMSPFCVCTPQTGWQNCSVSAQCPKREVCVSGAVDGSDVCIGKVIADQNDDIVQIDAVSPGLTFDPCRTNINCSESGVGLRVCVGLDNNFCEGVPGGSCTCIPFDGLRFCGSNGGCPNGEVCAQGLVQGVQYEGHCMSSSFVDRVDSVDEYDGPGNGGTMLPCINSGGCEGDKMCADVNTFESPLILDCKNNISPLCLCAPKSGLMFCDSSAECPDGEACVTNPWVDPICASRSAIDDERPLFEEVFGASPTPLEIDGATPGPSEGDGLTLDACGGTSEVGGCKNPRECFTLDAGFGLTTEMCSGESDKCVCASRNLIMCTSSTDCVGMEVCASGFPLPADRSTCVSRNALSEFGMNEVQDENIGISPSPTVSVMIPGSATEEPTGSGPTPAMTPTPGVGGGGAGSTPPSDGVDPSPSSTDLPPDDMSPFPSMSPSVENEDGGSSNSSPSPSISPRAPICVDARALAHMRPEELVFDEHNLAGVLCDENESCATPGHMVVFNGKAIMMKTYCELVSCERRVMVVNSPKYQRRLRVESNTEGLLYTAFAARYATRGEELALWTLTRLGL